MAANKECPSCQSEVPRSAFRCKHCFHDFTPKPKAPLWRIPLVLSGALAGMGLLASFSFYFASNQALESRIQVDQESQSVKYITKYRNGVETKRLLWSDITRLEHVIGTGGTHEIAAYTLQGDRWLIVEPTKNSLVAEARGYESLMQKPLVVVDQTRGFQKRADDDKAASASH